MACLAFAAVLLLMAFMLEENTCQGIGDPPSAVEYWQKVLPSLPLPAELLKRVSPLDSSPGMITHYMEMISSLGRVVRPGRISGLCNAARLYCSHQEFAAFRQAINTCCLQLNYRKPMQRTKTEQDNDGNSFFRESDLVEGALLVLQDQTERTPTTSFLPRQLANRLHSASPNLLQGAFGIPPSSLLAKESMHTSHAMCKADAEGLLPGEEAFCTYSLEDLADVVKARVVLSTSSSPKLQLLPVSSSSANTVRAKLLKVQLKAEATQRHLSCHAATYPFAVYYCHYTPNARIYSATFEAATAGAPSEIIHAVAVCHLDTSDWNPHHVAFADLHSTPGHTEACHWTHENSLIFVAST